MKKNIRIQHTPLTNEQVKIQVQTSNLQSNTPAVGVALKAALERS